MCTGGVIKRGKWSRRILGGELRAGSRGLLACSRNLDQSSGPPGSQLTCQRDDSRAARMAQGQGGGGGRHGPAGERWPGPGWASGRGDTGPALGHRWKERPQTCPWLRCVGRGKWGHQGTPTVLFRVARRGEAVLCFVIENIGDMTVGRSVSLSVPQSESSVNRVVNLPSRAVAKIK